MSNQVEGTMRYATGSAATFVLLMLAAIAGAQTVQNGSEPRQANVEVVMKDKAFHITQGEMWIMSTQGGSWKGFLLMGGTRADIRLRNEDSVAHEFVSPLLYNLPFQLSGGSMFVEAPKAAGVRVDPGQTVVLSFQVPQDIHELQYIYDVFWCNVHGKHHTDLMRGEILIMDVR